jgi:hypothetical protein
MQAMMSRIVALEADMESTGTFVFGGHLYGPDAASVVRVTDGQLIITDRPFVVATRRWSSDGIPPNPAGWIITTARHRAVDQLRRSDRRREFARTMSEVLGSSSESTVDQQELEGPVNCSAETFGAPIGARL